MFSEAEPFGLTNRLCYSDILAVSRLDSNLLSVNPVTFHLLEELQVCKFSNLHSRVSSTLSLGYVGHVLRASCSAVYWF